VLVVGSDDQSDAGSPSYQSPVPDDQTSQLQPTGDSDIQPSYADSTLNQSPYAAAVDTEGLYDDWSISILTRLAVWQPYTASDMQTNQFISYP